MLNWGTWYFTTSRTYLIGFENEVIGAANEDLLYLMANANFKMVQALKTSNFNAGKIKI
jgi:hypothetical protein